MTILSFANQFLVPEDKSGDRLTHLIVNICTAATITAVLAATLTLVYGHVDYAVSIYIAAATIPLALIILKHSQTIYPAAHYLTANIFLQCMLLAAEPALGCMVLIALAAGVALLDAHGGRIWLALIAVYCAFVAAQSSTELTSAIAAVSLMLAVVVYLIVYITEKSRVRSSVRAEVKTRQASNQLAVLQELVRSSFDAYLQTTSREITYASRSIEDLLGYPSDKLMDRSFSYYLHPEESHILEQLGAGQAPWRAEIRLRHADGHWLWTEAYGAPDIVFGNPNRSFIVLRNFESQRKVSDQLLQAQRLESMGTVAAAVSHDFNNMLTVILGLADELPASETRTEITRVATNAAALTNKLLNFGHGHLRSSEIHDLSHLMTELSPLVQHSLDSRFVLIEEYSDKPTLVRIDEYQLEQVLMNLVNNARDAMPAGGELEVTLQTVELAETSSDEPQGHFALIEVRDTGSGMDEKTVRKVFDPFFTTKQTHVNSGLGLSSCYGIVSQYGGFIQIDSEIDVGTVVKVYLPIAETRDHTPVSNIQSVGESVLIVDDEPGVVRVMRNALVRAGYKVRDFTDTDEAINFFENHEVSLLITDVVMPKLSGADLVRRLRKQNTTLPVLFVSGFTNDELDEWQQDEYTSFLAKPFRGDEILTRVEQLIAKPLGKRQVPE